jgi:hypothetical protein
MTGHWAFDLTGYLLGVPVLLWGMLASRYRGARPVPVSRIVWVVLGLVLIAGNIGQNIIEFRDL